MSKVIHFYQLITYGVSYTLAAIAHVYCPNATRHGIEMLFAFLIPNTVAFAFHDDTWVNSFKGFMLNQVVPYVGAVILNDFLDVISGH